MEIARLDGHSNQVRALCVLPGGRLVSGAYDNTIRLWDLESRREITRLELDACVTSVLSLSDQNLIAGDNLGRLHWLEVVK